QNTALAKIRALSARDSIRKFSGGTSFEAGAEVIHALAKAVFHSHFRLIPQLGLRARNVGLTVFDIARPGRLVNRLDLRAQKAVHLIDQLEQAGAAAASNVINLAADLGHVGGE